MELRTRGIHYFPGRVTCPLAGVGRRAADASNRLALDDDETVVSIERDQITIRNERRYATKTTVADLTFLAVGTSATGEQAPCCIHLKVEKTGDTVAIDLHPHVRDTTRFVRVDFEPFHVRVESGGRTTVALDPARAARQLTELSVSLKVAMSMLSVTDHLAGVTQDPAQAGYRVADLSVGVGIGALGLRYNVVRARLVSLEASNAPLIARGSVVDMLRDGAWELELTALSSRWLTETIQRDMFLFGLERIALLRDVHARGLRKGQSLAFRIGPERGEIVLDGQMAPLADAHDVARAYLEFHVLGGLLAKAAERRS